jgi:benzoylsuccinyl-CoA thiolase BbsA subunit
MTDKVKKQKDDAITFFHPDLLEIPVDKPPYLKGYKCTHCGKLWFPKFTYCPNPDCWSEDMTVIPLSRKGILYSVSKVYIGQPSMRDYMPLIVGYVDLPEGIRVFSQLQGTINDLSCGDEVELIVGPVRNNNRGEPIVSYKFRKAG